MIWVLYALLSAIFLSISEIFQKKGLFKEHAMEFNVAKFSFSFLLLLVLIPFVDFNIPIVVWLIFLFSVTLGAIGNLYRSKAYKHMEISSVAPFFNLSPAFVAVIAFFILGEQITGKQISGIIVLIIGAYVLEVDHNIHNLLGPIKKIIRSKYLHYIFLVLLLFGFCAIIDKKLITDYLDPFQMLFLASLFLVLNYFSMSFFSYGFKGIKDSFKKGKKEAFLSAFFWNIEIFFCYMALSLQLVSLVIPIKRLSTLFTTIGGGTIFKDKGLHLKVIACIIMFAGAYLVVS